MDKKALNGTKKFRIFDNYVFERFQALEYTGSYKSARTIQQAFKKTTLILF